MLFPILTHVDVYISVF